MIKPKTKINIKLQNVTKLIIIPKEPLKIPSSLPKDPS